jgi:hypothetical protein
MAATRTRRREEASPEIFMFCDVEFCLLVAVGGDAPVFMLENIQPGACAAPIAGFFMWNYCLRKKLLSVFIPL